MAEGTVRIVSRLFSPEVAAAAFRLRALAEALVAQGCSVEVVTATAAGATSERDGDLRVSRWPVLRDANGNVRGYFQYLSFDVPALARLLARSRPALLVVEPPPTTGLVVRVVASLQRVPYAYYAADVWSRGAVAAGAPRYVTLLLRRIESWVMRGAVRVLAVSEGVAEEVAALGVTRERIVVVGNGADTVTFTPDGPAVALDAPYFVYAGTMSEWQGAEVFLHAFAEHSVAFPSSRLVFLGQGTDAASLERLADSVAPGRVDFRGVVAPEEAARWIRGASAALVSIRPGLGYDFAEPTKIFAATACGTPVIFAGAGAGRALVNSHGLGWGTEYGAAEVAQAMAQALGPGDGRSRHLVEWTEANASLRAVGQRASQALLQGAGLA